MSPLQFTELPYPEDVAELFAPIAARPWAAWLDSGAIRGQQSRYDILVSDPYATLVTEQNITSFVSGETHWQSGDDPFSLLRQCLAEYPLPLQNGIPFFGGAVGFFAYDLARNIETLPALALDDLASPRMMIGFYDWALVVDHEERHCRIYSAHTQMETAPRLEAILQTLLQHPPKAGRGFDAVGEIHSNLNRASYDAAFARIQHYLREGDCYQVNFAQRFEVSVEGDPFRAYRHWRDQSPAPFGAYLNTPYGQVMCNSPERFLRLRKGQVETRPIKGTRPRAEDPVEDAALAQSLLSSIKDRAENVMIVDLLRNDLAKCCRAGSIKVPELFRLESYATVHQLVSQVIGELNPGEDALSLLRHCFPGGSITGAPKRRAMEIIEELEPHRRGLYCGAIAYLGFDGGMDSNIVIRTALHREGQLWYSAGGGIVSDSVCEDEYRESYHKASAFFRMLGSPVTI